MPTAQELFSAAIGDTPGDNRLVPIGAHIRASSNTALTINAPAGASAIMLQAAGEDLRVIFDGVTVPTTTDGFLFTVADVPFLIDLGANSIVRCIGVTGVSSFIQYQWFGTLV